MKPDIFQQVGFNNEAYFERANLDRIRRDGYLENYLLSVAVLIILRWADRLETEEEAIAEFEGHSFQRTLPRHLSWSHWKNLSPEELRHRLRESLHSARDNGGNVAEILSRLAAVYDSERVDPRSLEEALLMVGFTADGSISGGPRLAAAYDQLIADYAEATSHGFGQSVTPQPIAELMVELTNPQPGESIYDPCFGGASMLAAAGRRIVEEGQKLSPAKWAEAENRAIYGVEINAQTFALGMPRVLLSGINNPHLELGDTLLRNDRRESPPQFDCVLANPPFGARVNETYANEGIYAKSSKSENLFLQHVMASLKPDGRAAVLLPEGVLFGSGADEHVRRRLLEEFCVEGVISLPSGALGLYTGIKTSIVIFRRGEPTDAVWFQTAELNLKSGKVAGSDLAEEINKQVELFREQKPGTHGWFTPVEVLAERGWALVAERSEDEIIELIEKLQQTDAEIQIEKLSDLADIFPGINFSTSNMTEDQSKLTYQPPTPLVRVSDLKNGRLMPPKRYLTEAGLIKVQDKHRLKSGDILLSVTGTIGKAAIVYSEESGAIPAQNLLAIRPEKTKVNPNFLLRLLQSVPYQKRFKASSRGSTIQHLSVHALRSLLIPVPSIEIQNQIGFDLPSGADASTMLQSLVTGRAASVLESFLLTDPAVNDLLTGYPSFDLERLKKSLVAVARSMTTWRNRISHDQFASKALTTWLFEATHITEFLTLAFDSPNAAERLAILENLRNRWTRITFDAPGMETTALAQRIEAINILLHRTIENERDRIQVGMKVTGRTEPPIIDAGKSADLTIWLKNEGPVVLMKFRASDPTIEESSNPAVEKRFLQPGEEVAMPLSFPAQTAVGTQELRVPWQAVQLDGSEARGSSLVAVEVRSLRSTAKAVEIGSNPYEVGDPITSVEMFFGREDILERIRRKLGEQGATAVFLLEGNRRTGKTSILNRLLVPGYLSDCLPVYISMQDLEGDSKVAGVHTDEIFYGLARNLILAVRKADFPFYVVGVGNVGQEMPEREFKKLLRGAFREEFKKGSPFEVFRTQLEEVLEAIGQMRVLLMLDEFDKVQEGIDHGVTSPQLPENLRFIFQTYPRVSAILTGWRIRRMREEYRNALYGIGIPLKVSALDEAAARELVIRPVTGRLIIPPSIRDEIVDLCARQPYLLQYLCDRLFEECAMVGARTVTRALVDEAASKIVSSKEGFEHFIKLWEFIGTNRRRYLSCLINELSAGPDLVTFDLLTERLSQGENLYPAQGGLGDDLEQLRELEIVALREEAGQKVYSLQVPLFARWLRSEKDSRDYLQRALIEVEETEL
ncbi:MAG: N-6 DNA methylase [Acidobacteria bacterium]|nr:N-6 DNA methylase [Acidobacteriota bacterium]